MPVWPWLLLCFAQSRTRVIIVMSVSKYGSYLALINITSHPVWVELKHNCSFFRANAKPSFPMFIIHSCHIVCRLTLKSKPFYGSFLNTQIVSALNCLVCLSVVGLCIILSLSAVYFLASASPMFCTNTLLCF